MGEFVRWWRAAPQWQQFLIALGIVAGALLWLAVLFVSLNATPIHPVEVAPVSPVAPTIVRRPPSAPADPPAVRGRPPRPPTPNWEGFGENYRAKGAAMDRYLAAMAASADNIVDKLVIEDVRVIKKVAPGTDRLMYWLRVRFRNASDKPVMEAWANYVLHTEPASDLARPTVLDAADTKRDCMFASWSPEKAIPPGGTHTWEEPLVDVQLRAAEGLPPILRATVTPTEMYADPPEVP